MKWVGGVHVINWRQWTCCVSETALLAPPPPLQLLLRAKLHVTESQMSYTTILDSTLHCGKKHP